MEKLFFPSSISVIGASRDPSAWGHTILKNLLNGGYRGKIFPVNPKADAILGVRCYRSIKEIPESVDLAIIVVPAYLVPPILEECGAKGVSFTVIISAGFREAGGKGVDLEREVIAIARRYGIRIVGPNCMGLYNSYHDMTATFTSLVPRRGGVSFISQSGAVGITMLAWAKMEGIGFSKFISVGNEADVSLPEILSYLVEDKSSRVIAMYMESVKNGYTLVNSMRTASIKKPVVVMKVGATASGANVAASHTGAMAVEDAVIDGIFRQFCVIRAMDSDELFHLASSFAELPLPRRRSAIVISTGGGWAVECADLADMRDLSLVPLPADVVDKIDKILPPYWSRRNPVDMVATPNPESYYRVLEISLKNEAYDMAFLIGYGTIGSISVSSMTSREVEFAVKISDLIRLYKKPVFVVDFLGASHSESARAFIKSGIPIFNDVRSAVNVAANMVRYSEYINKSKERIGD